MLKIRAIITRIKGKEEKKAVRYSCKNFVFLIYYLYSQIANAFDEKGGLMALIELKNVSFSYDKKTDAIKNLSLSIERGEKVAVIGHNGSGKSTLAKLFNALIKPDGGSVIVDGFSSDKKEDLFEIRKRVGVVFQNPENQLVASIVEDDVAFGPENLGIEREEIGKRIDFALKSVDMEDFRFRSPERLSGGQKQRIAIAGVLALKPEVLVLDEATSMLDPKGRKEILGIAEKLNREQGTTIINVTHYIEEIVGYKKIFLLKDGELVFCGTPEETFKKVDLIESCGLILPRATQIANKLKRNGIPLPDGILTEERLLVELCKLK